jgi:allophanate hydrolase
MSSATLDLTLGTLQQAYRSGALTPATLVEQLIAARARWPSHGIWITPVSDDALRARAAELALHDPASLPLYGVPFAIKDNLDLAGLPTTAACPAFAYTPTQSAAVVQRLLDAGAIAVGKTNLDQFATGLVGTRSPHGPGRNSFDRDYISGGSSSGSALAVALGLASFSLGTDTAGSGRVPAAFNNIVGLKPSCGRLSNRGMVPACRSLDAVSIFALTTDDAASVLQVAGAFDAQDPWSRPYRPSERAGWSARGPLRFGVPKPEQLEFFGNAAYAAAFAETVARLQGLGHQSVTVDIEPLLETARLLYEGPWVTERYLATLPLIAQQPEALLPVTRQIIGAGAAPRATDAFSAQYRLAELRRASEPLWQDIDLLLLPTAGTHYRIDEVDADPVRTNSNLGRYTNFVNLLDMAGLAVPAGFTPQGLPFGVTLIAPRGEDEDLLTLGGQLHRASVGTLGATGVPLPPASGSTALAAAPEPTIDVAVCGAHMEGLPLHGQLSSRRARLKARTHTAPLYRLYALPGGPPRRPGLLRVASGGRAIEVEVWSVPAAAFGSFVDGIPSPLGFGRVQLADGSSACGFLCEALAVTDAEDISRFGGWRAWLEQAPGR